MDNLLANIEQYRDQFYRFVLRNVWDSSLADDVFAAAVLAAYENYGKFTPGTNFRAWMFKILVNKCFVANRETKRMFEPLEEDHAADPSDVYVDAFRDPKALLEQCGDEVYHAFRRLSTAQRSCILLKDVERFSYKEIAEMLGIPVATVMTHLARGRAVLRRDLLEYALKRGIVRPLPRLIPKPAARGQQSAGSVVIHENT